MNTRKSNLQSRRQAPGSNTPPTPAANAAGLLRQTVKYEHEHVWIKPVCDFFEIDYVHQRRFIKNDPVLANQVCKKTSSLAFGDNYQRILLTKKGFVRWVQLLKPNTVKEDLRPLLVQYQTAVFDYLYGSMEEKERTATVYKRLHKLRRLKGKIDAEIRACTGQVNTYLHSHLQGQLTIAGTEKRQGHV